jgi:hypothetical protein
MSSRRATPATERSKASSRATTGTKTATPAAASRLGSRPASRAQGLSRTGSKNADDDNVPLLDRTSAMSAEDKKETEAVAARLLLEKITLGKKFCPKPFIGEFPCGLLCFVACLRHPLRYLPRPHAFGLRVTLQVVFGLWTGMRVKLSPEVPVFIRDLTEPAVKYRRPPPLIGTVVKVVGDPMEQKHVHEFKYRRCNQTNRSDLPIAMWCDVLWDAPANGQEITITGYHTGRFNLHYLWLVAEEDDPFNDHKNVRLREETAKKRELQEAIAKRVRERVSDTMLPAVKGATGEQSRPASGTRTPGSGFTPRYWSESQAATEQRNYHSKEALERGLDPAGQEKALERMVSFVSTRIRKRDHFIQSSVCVFLFLIILRDNALSTHTGDC